MYRHCIFCSRALGVNDTLEDFPVGRSVAFDAWKGRLWAVCRSCGRWNLAPIGERWEAVEAAEKLFRDTRVRVHSENIGLTRARDGTRLIRIGEALPGEVAVLRYGGELIRRRRAHYWGGGAAVAGAGMTAAAGLPLLMAAGLPATVLFNSAQIASVVAQRRARRKVVQTIDAADSPTGAPLVIRREHLYDALLEGGEDGSDLVLRLPPTVARRTGRDSRCWDSDEAMLTLRGAAAQRTLARAMTDYNSRGATPQAVEQAFERLTAAGTAEEYRRSLTGNPLWLVRPEGNSMRRNRRKGPLFPTPRQILGTFRGEVMPINRKPALTFKDGRQPLNPTDALALEMALHEESERVALQGELAGLEAACREAEEIAAIADDMFLPDDTTDRLATLRGRAARDEPAT
jgi:hypothetical protein